jgi:hypothetical protein
MSQNQSTALDASALFRRVSFLAEKPTPLKTLSGWNKSHSVPEASSSRAQDYIAGISTSELKQDLDTIYESLKQAFKFKRRELSVAEPADGTGTIATPFFNYSISIALSPDAPSQAIWTRTVDGITEPREVAAPAFAQVFDGVFRTLQFSLPQPIDVENCIDAIEDADISNLEITYDRDATYCDLRFKEAASTIHITAGALSIVEKSPATISTLFHSLRTLQELVRDHNLPMNW